MRGFGANPTQRGVLGFADLGYIKMRLKLIQSVCNLACCSIVVNHEAA